MTLLWSKKVVLYSRHSILFFSDYSIKVFVHKAHWRDDRNGIFSLLSILSKKNFFKHRGKVLCMFTNGSISFFSSSKSEYISYLHVRPHKTYLFLKFMKEHLTGKIFVLVLLAFTWRKRSLPLFVSASCAFPVYIFFTYIFMHTF